MEDSASTPTVPADSHPPAKGFIGTLLDFSFESFVTPTIIRFLYGLSLVAVVLSTLGWVFAGGNFTGFLWHVLTAPIVLIVGVILARVYIELIMLAFKILELLRRIEANQRNSSPKV